MVTFVQNSAELVLNASSWVVRAPAHTKADLAENKIQDKCRQIVRGGSAKRLRCFSVFLSTLSARLRHGPPRTIVSVFFKYFIFLLDPALRGPGTLTQLGQHPMVLGDRRPHAGLCGVDLPHNENHQLRLLSFGTIRRSTILRVPD